MAVDIGLDGVSQRAALGFKLTGLALVDQDADLLGPLRNPDIGQSLLAEGSLLLSLLALHYNVDLCQESACPIRALTFSNLHAPTFPKFSPTLLGERAKTFKNQADEAARKYADDR